MERENSYMKILIMILGLILLTIILLVGLAYKISIQNTKNEERITDEYLS